MVLLVVSGRAARPRPWAEVNSNVVGPTCLLAAMSGCEVKSVVRRLEGCAHRSEMQCDKCNGGFNRRFRPFACPKGPWAEGLCDTYAAEAEQRPRSRPCDPGRDAPSSRSSPCGGKVDAKPMALSSQAQAYQDPQCPALAADMSQPLVKPQLSEICVVSVLSAQLRGRCRRLVKPRGLSSLSSAGCKTNRDLVLRSTLPSHASVL